MTVVQDRWFTETFAYGTDGRCVRDERRQVVYTDAAGHVFEKTRAVDFTFTASAAPGYVQSVRMTSGTETRTVTFSAGGNATLDVWGEGTPMELRTDYERTPAGAVTHVMVTCGGAHGLTAGADVTEGQNSDVIARRLRGRCDADLNRAR